MALPQRKTTPASAAPVMTPVNFLDPAMYTGGNFIPDGDYILEFSVMEHQALDKNNAPKGPKRLGVMIGFYPFENPTEDAKHSQFYSMGSKAMESFAPHPDSDKMLVARPNAPSASLNDKTNWMEFLRSMMNAGLPPGVGTSDLSVIDGTWAHITNVEEPAERSSFQSNTSEVQQEQRKPGKIAVVSAILEGGAPWEGGGGIPEAAPTKPAAATKPSAAAPKPGVKGLPKPTAAPAPAASGADDLAEVAAASITTVLVANPNGLARLALRNKVFAGLKKSASEEVASQVIDAYFSGNDDNLNAILGELGYACAGGSVTLAA